MGRISIGGGKSGTINSRYWSRTRATSPPPEIETETSKIFTRHTRALRLQQGISEGLARGLGFGKGRAISGQCTRKWFFAARQTRFRRRLVVRRRRPRSFVSSDGDRMEHDTNAKASHSPTDSGFLIEGRAFFSGTKPLLPPFLPSSS